MNASEARGYIRAHAAPIIEAELDVAVSRQRGPARQHALVASIAQQALVETLVGEVVRVQKTVSHHRRAA
jgi:hypothetical protein